MDILIVKLSAIGDVVLSQPFLASLKKRFPDARITWLVEEAASGLLADHPLLDRVIVSRRKSWAKDLKKGRIIRAAKDVGRFLRELWSVRYDIVVDLQGLFKSGILAFLSGGRRRIGFDKTREMSWIFVNERLAPYDPDRHALDRYLDVARYLGGEPVEDYVLPVHEASSALAESLLKDLPRPLAAVNPGAKWKTKLWPEEYWPKLVKKMRDAGISVIVTGGPDETEQNAKVSAAAPGVRNLTGKTDLLTLAELFRQMDLVVCPDTGPMHLAAAVDTPVAALFGPTAHYRTGPYGRGHTVISTNVDCRPCFLKSCESNRCMTDITPDAVMAAVKAKLKLRPEIPE